MDPDEQARHVVGLVFRKFEELGTLHGVLGYLVDHGVRLPFRERAGAAKGELSWRRPNRQTLHNMLRNPIYAGAYAYGRRRVDPRRRKPGGRDTGRVALPLRQWTVLIKDRLPAYISGSTTSATWPVFSQTARARRRWDPRVAGRVCLRGWWSAASAGGG